MDYPIIDQLYLILLELNLIKIMNTQITSQFDKNSISDSTFHLLSPSPCPLLSSFDLLILTVGAVIFFNG